MRVFETGGHLLVDLNGSLAETVAARWSQFVFSEDVQIANESTTTAQIGVYGPAAASVVARALAGDRPDRFREIDETIRSLPLYANRAWDLVSGSACVIVSDDIGVRGLDIVVPLQFTPDPSRRSNVLVASRLAPKWRRCVGLKAACRSLASI